jgi:hypothetical protein
VLSIRKLCHTVGSLKSTLGMMIKGNHETDMHRELVRRDNPKPGRIPKLHVEFDANVIRSLAFVSLLQQLIRKLSSHDRQRALPLKHRVQNEAALVRHRKWGQSFRAKPVAIVVSADFEFVEVYGRVVCVSDSDCESEIVIESSVFGTEIKLGERDVFHTGVCLLARFRDHHEHQYAYDEDNKACDREKLANTVVTITRVGFFLLFWFISHG